MALRFDRAVEAEGGMVRALGDPAGEVVDQRPDLALPSDCLGAACKWAATAEHELAAYLPAAAKAPGQHEGAVGRVGREAVLRRQGDREHVRGANRCGLITGNQQVSGRAAGAREAQI